MPSHTRILAEENVALKRLIADIEANAVDADPNRSDADRLVGIRTAIATSGVDVDSIRELIGMIDG